MGTNKNDKALRDMRQKIEDEYQKKQSDLFEKWNVGFCFGQWQFDEYVKKQRAKGYTGEFAPVNKIAPGMVIRVEGYKEFIYELVSLHKEWKQAKRNAWNMDAYIEHTMWNHETFYTGMWWDENMVNDVRHYFPEAKKEDFERVYCEVQKREEEVA